MKVQTLPLLAALTASSVSAFSINGGNLGTTSRRQVGASFTSSHSTTALDAERKPFISGNWKLNPQTKEEAVALATEIADAIGSDSPDADVALFVPYVFIEAAMAAVNGKLEVGAEVREEEGERYQSSTTNLSVP
jgi:Triosephosphate isomerase